MSGDLLRFLGKDGKVRLRVFWPDDSHELELSEDDWRKVARGERFSEVGDDYCYDGQDFGTTWIFNSCHPGSLLVTYQRLDDETGSEGEGFVGSITSAIIRTEP
jgi:hypothetical protein